MADETIPSEALGEGRPVAVDRDWLNLGLSPDEIAAAIAVGRPAPYKQPHRHRLMLKALVEWCAPDALRRLELDSIPAAGSWDMQRLLGECAKGIREKAREEKKRLHRSPDPAGRRAKNGRPPKDQRVLIAIALLAEEIAVLRPSMSDTRRFKEAAFISASALRLPKKDSGDFIEKIAKRAHDAYRGRGGAAWVARAMEDCMYEANVRPRLPRGGKLAKRLLAS